MQRKCSSQVPSVPVYEKNQVLWQWGRCCDTLGEKSVLTLTHTGEKKKADLCRSHWFVVQILFLYILEFWSQKQPKTSSIDEFLCLVEKMPENTMSEMFELLNYACIFIICLIGILICFCVIYDYSANLFHCN